MNPVVSEHEQHDATMGKYIAGFVGSIVLTVTSYVLVRHHGISRDVVIGIISVLAVVQFIVQMVFFLHVGSERRPRWKLAVMFLMLSVVLILVGGSLWIMNNLNYRMTPQQMDQYLRSQDSL